jgi:hypothetical protein
VTGEDEIVVQGDVYDNIADFIKDKWPQVKLLYTYHCPQSTLDITAGNR